MTHRGDIQGRGAHGGGGTEEELEGSRHIVVQELTGPSK